MSQPLGREVGNANEIRESVEVLQGKGPPDLVELVYRLGAEMLVLGGLAADNDDGHTRMESVIASGAAFEKLKEVTAVQGGDIAVLDNPSLLPSAENKHLVTASRSGIVVYADAMGIGVGAMRLGAGRGTKEDKIDPGVGTTVHVDVGDEVGAGTILATIAYNDDTNLADAVTLTTNAFLIADGPVRISPLVHEEIR